MVALSVRTTSLLVASLGVLVAVIGGILLALFPGLVKQRIRENLKILNGSELFANWEESPVPIYMQFYFFNITNAADIMNSGAKPNLQEVGPYTYREFRKKQNISWNEDSTLVSFSEEKSFVFQPNKSVGDLQDIITTVNIPIVTITNKLKGLNVFARLTVNSLLEKEGLFVTETVDNLLFKGYKIHIIDKIQKFTKKEALPGGLFALAKNNTIEGRFTIHTGVGNTSNFADVQAFNEASVVSYWNDEHCNKINGSDGSRFAPFLTKETIAYVFSSELCRSIYFIYEQDTEEKGIPVYKFILPGDLFASPDQNPDNACFCLNPSFCNYSGLLNVSICKNEAPISFSAPHFYQASEKFLDDVIGLNPNKEEHEAVLKIEPTTGVVISAMKRLQVNVFIENIPGFRITQRASGILYPIMWMNESAKVTPDLAKLFRSKVLAPVEVGKTILRILIATGSIIIISVFVFGILYNRKSRTIKDTSTNHVSSTIEDDAAAQALMSPNSKIKEDQTKEI